MVASVGREEELSNGVSDHRRSSNITEINMIRFDVAVSRIVITIELGLQSPTACSRSTGFPMLVQLIEDGIEAQNQKQREFYDLAEPCRALPKRHRSERSQASR